ncbi:uncharacterized protein K444DRAFT_613335 [Hyaloscypha bicolor E]|uniref:Uncharacterized protein n=1 Tax=Hyaloscypha bicolor E TaxID=1095630 RepID=A0A2J6T8K3_9HELO|nr:uncharacterized protein K444DRAFT_613335 [Hyaloscypha bicolor E]PMD59359.1 hypothetical protein K444DRAFT_613335 [Hyaloscypha bicolor E]
MSGEELPSAVKLMIEKEVERRAGELRRAGYLWTDMPLHEKAWFVVSNCILLATFATTIWLGISQRRADDASVSMAQTAANANTIAEQSLQLANKSETLAIEALSQASANNNISATNNNNVGYQEWLMIEQYCATNPLSNITFTNATGNYNCSQILNTSVSLPVICSDSGNGVDFCPQTPIPTPSPSAQPGGFRKGSLVGIVVGVSLPSVIIILASILFCWRRRRMNNRILGSSGTTEI